MTLLIAAEALRGCKINSPGCGGWKQIVQIDPPVSYSLTFKDDVLHSGFFWAHIPSDTHDWDEADRVESDRRAVHERMMYEWVGASTFSGSTMLVYLLRDPRSFLEEIFFEIAS